MNKIYVILAMIFVMFSVSVSAATVTMISGTVTDQDSNAVSGATVEVTCYHGADTNMKTVTSGSDGKYYAFFPILQCDAGDDVSIHAYKGDASGNNDGTVEYNKACRINTEIVDVQIPEFGVVAAAVALVGALGILVYRRKD